MLKLKNQAFARNGLVVAQEFNANVLKGQLNPNGETVAKLAEMIDDAQTAVRWFQSGMTSSERIDELEKQIASHQEEIKKLKAQIPKSAIRILPMEFKPPAEKQDIWSPGVIRLMSRVQFWRRSYQEKRMEWPMDLDQDALDSDSAEERFSRSKCMLPNIVLQSLDSPMLFRRRQERWFVSNAENMMNVKSRKDSP